MQSCAAIATTNWPTRLSRKHPATRRRIQCVSAISPLCHGCPWPRRSQGEICFTNFDAKSRASTRDLILSAVDKYKRVDVLVNNVGVQKDNGIPAHLLDDDIWDEVLAVNLTRSTQFRLDVWMLDVKEIRCWSATVWCVQLLHCVEVRHPRPCQVRALCACCFMPQCVSVFSCLHAIMLSARIACLDVLVADVAQKVPSSTSHRCKACCRSVASPRTQHPRAQSCHSPDRWPLSTARRASE